MGATNQLKAAATGKSDNPVVLFRNFLERQKGQISAALPKHLTADRMIRLAVTEFAKNPLLQKCSDLSIYSSLIQASQLGLEIGVLGQAYLIPFKNHKTGQYEAQMLPGYKGLIALARRSGEVISIETHLVYENDEFELNLGINSSIRHVPDLDGDRGRIKLVYGVAKFKDGGYHLEWMSIHDVERIKSRSKASTNGPWVTDYEQMVRKTLIRRMVNYLPMSIELAAAIQVSDSVDDGKKAHIDGDFVVVEEQDEEQPNQESAANVQDIKPVDTEPKEKVTFAQVAQLINDANTQAELNKLVLSINKVPNEDHKMELKALFTQRNLELQNNVSN